MIGSPGKPCKGETDSGGWAKPCTRAASTTRDGQPLCAGHAERYDQRERDRARRLLDMALVSLLNQAGYEARALEVGWVRVRTEDLQRLVDQVHQTEPT